MKANKHAMKPSMTIISVVLCLLFLLGSFSALAAEREPSEELSAEQTAEPEVGTDTEPSDEPSDEPSEEPMEGPLSLWSEDSMAREELSSYMEAVTDESSADYIPVDHRVAVFDLDGTLFCETDPNYFDYCLLKYRVLDDPDYKDVASDFEREVALKIQEQNETGASFEGLEVDHGKAVASAFAGMTPEEFNAYIQEFKKQPMPTYDGMNRGDGWYLPMLQVVDYLKENDFTVYIVSGTDRFIVRGIVDGSPLDLPPWQIIGSDETLVAADQGETDGLSYVYDEDDALVLGGEFIVKNLKMNKVTVIAQEIGVQPVLSFGNSTGDSSMAAYVTGGNPYRSLAFMLCCDDTERENGNIEKADKMFDLCGTYGWVPVSMKNDWTTIYGDDVTYLGVPHPTEATEPMEILAGMTVEQKLAQMTMVAFSELDEVTADCLSMTQPGGILLFAGNTPSAADTAVLTAELQQLALGTSGIPLLISTDQEGGYIVRMTESTWFPGNMALAATGDADNAYRAASVMGEELLACGINVDFGPVVDVNSNPLNPVIGVRAFGAEPETVAAFGAAYLNGLHEAGVISSLKHFPGHGDTDTDSHTGLPSVDKSLDELRSFELVPFQTAIDTGADMVMTAHIVYPQVETTTVTSAADGEEVYLPATLSHTILTDLLRDEMGFEGVIVTDSLIMDAIADNFGLTEAAAMAINAGADVLLDPVRIQTEEDCETYTQLIQDLAVLVEEGTISKERLDESVLRILELKDKYGILDREQYGIEPNEAAANAQAAVHNEEHKTAEREITEQAITLLKNDGVIPYTAQEDEKIVVLTAWDSEAPAAEYGMQTAVEAGAIPAGADIEVVSCDERRIGDISEAIDGASLCIILSRMGSEAYLDPTSTTGAAGTLVDIVIDRVHEQGGKVIVVSVQLPYDTARFPEADAIIAAYNPTGSRKLMTEDTGETTYNYAPNIPTALRMIFDGTPMTGTLPVSVPALTADYAFADEILYPAGFSVFEGEADQITCGIHEINDFGNVILDIYPSELEENGYEAGDIVSVTVGGETWQMPYGTGSSDVDPGYMILVAKTDSLVLAVNQQSFAEAAGLTEENADSSITIRLEEKGGYLRQYEVRNMSYSDEREDYASDEEFANFRNIVMGDIPAGVLYRSASGIIDDHGRPAFVNALCEVAGIHTVIDLAQNAEDIEALAAEAKTGSFYLDLFSGSGVVANGSLGIDMTSEKFKTGLAEDLRGMLSQEAPYIIQCAEGKDRTGAVAMILEALMGASYDEMLEDYMASFVNYYHLEKGDERYQAIMDGNAAYLFMTLSGTEHVTDMEKADYQAAAEAYLLSAGLGEDEIAQLIMCLSEG